MARELHRKQITTNRWITFYEAGAVVYDRIYGWWDAFPLIPTAHPQRHAEEASLVARLRRSYTR